MSLLGEDLQTPSKQLCSYLADFMEMSVVRLPEPKSVQSKARKRREEWIKKTGEAKGSSEIVL